MVVSNAPTLLAIASVGLLWLETPRFQAASQGDTGAAWETFRRLTPHKSKSLLLQKLHLPVDSPFPPTDKFDGIDVTDPQDRTIAKAIKNQLRGLVDFLQLRAYRRTTFSLSLLWILQTFAHWGMSSYLPVFYTHIGVNSTLTTAGSYIVQLPGNLLIYYLMQWRLGGRLRAIQIFAFGSGCSLCLLAILLSVPGTRENRGGLIVSSLAAYFFGSPIWGALYALSAESYLTVNRGLAMAFFGCLGSVSTVITTYISAATLSESNPALFPMVWAALRFVCFLAAFIVPKETAAKDLMDVTHDP